MTFREVQFLKIREGLQYEEIKEVSVLKAFLHILEEWKRARGLCAVWFFDLNPPRGTLYKRIWSNSVGVVVVM